ncbi:hypothetical protein [Salegentibacter sp.]|uniref:hypothetical protein n=1 Tax=Salegentibacter sp. TaxID=1903072 RepID=UPI0035687D90
MENYKEVKRKLNAFISKYYRNKLLKGAILFTAVGLLYLFLIISIEHLFWLNTTGRRILFWLFIGIEAGLFIFFIAIPLSKLFRFSKTLSEEDASRIIGRHFPGVNDKLLNLLQLKNSEKESDLLVAGIDQKSRELNPIPFSAAVNFKSSLKYVKWAAFPVIIFLAIWLTGNSSIFSDSYGRVVHYNAEFQPPAPFYFTLENELLEVRQNKDFTLQVKTIGDMNPEQVSVNYNNQDYLLKRIEPGTFEYTFKRLEKDTEFSLNANGISSEKYTLEVLKVPAILNLETNFEYPAYTGKRSDSVIGTGNARIPEGTRVTWNLKARETYEVHFKLPDSSLNLKPQSGRVEYQSRVYSSLNYSISSSNKKIRNFEPVSYKIDIIKDRFPEIEVVKKTDSLEEQISYFYGKVSDDYGLSKLQLVYYPEASPDSLNQISIPVAKESFAEFLFTFPGDLELERGVNYLYYFQVFDNDGVNGAKSSRSEIFGFRKKTLEEIEEEKIQHQGESIENFNKSLEEIEYSRETLNEISRRQKETDRFDYNERKKLQDFLERQKQQNEMMKNYSEKLKKSLEEEDPSKEENSYKEDLKERLDKNEERLEENEALMEELKEFSEKISREELGEKLEELSKRNQSQQRNMEQLLELTKRYYVQEKQQKLARELQNLAERQERISEDEELNNKESQEKLSREFEEFRKEMDQLDEDNERLKQPVNLDRDQVDEESIEKDQRESETDLDKQQQNKAKEKQKEAAKKMMQMSAKMQQQMQAQSGEELEADIESLRQILDNLVRFSFQQEDLLETFKSMNRNDPMFARNLKIQNDLRENFRHVDDSLYSLALKNPMIGEEITGKLTDIEFDLEKALERLAEDQVPQGTASQQYVVTGANDLAYLLSSILSSMQQQANPQLGKGGGDGEEFQLPDIIQKQEEIQQQLEEGIEKNKGEKPNGEDGEGQEQESGELFEIYKQQQELRRELEKMINKEAEDPNGENLRDNMEQLEEELLDKGFRPQSLERMTNLVHELLKFEKARLEQGEDNTRKSETNVKEFGNSSKDQNLKAKEYFNSTEILNRQVLPLREIYKQKVKVYFERGTGTD